MAALKLDLNFMNKRPVNPALDDTMFQNICSTSLDSCTFPLPEVKDVSAFRERISRSFFLLAPHRLSPLRRRSGLVLFLPRMSL